MFQAPGFLLLLGLYLSNLPQSILKYEFNQNLTCRKGRGRGNKKTTSSRMGGAQRRFGAYFENAKRQGQEKGFGSLPFSLEQLVRQRAECATH